RGPRAPQSLNSPEQSSLPLEAQARRIELSERLAVEPIVPLKFEVEDIELPHLSKLRQPHSAPLELRLLHLHIGQRALRRGTLGRARVNKSGDDPAVFLGDRAQVRPDFFEQDTRNDVTPGPNLRELIV